MASTPPTSDLITVNEPSSNKPSTSGDSTPHPNRPQLYRPGQSGNPLGRPKGSKNRITLLKLQLEESLREQAAPQIAEVLQTAIDMALNERHPGMIKLLLELHMSKNAEQTDENADRKDVTINLVGLQTAPTAPGRVIDVTVEPPSETKDHD
jgi:hypothetical protein